MQMLREHPEYGIAAISEDAGFNSVRTFQRKCNEAVGMSPVEFRMLVDQAKKQL
jgi:AraC-like DNA-binding protein